LDFSTRPRRFIATNLYYPYARYNYPSGYLVDPEFGAVISQAQRAGMWRVTFSEHGEIALDGIEERIASYMRHVLPGHQDYDLRLYSAYRMHQSSAERYRIGWVLLCGDGAHVANPTSGFGLGGGMYDSFALSQALAFRIHGERGDEILDRYAHARRLVYLTVTSPISAKSLRLIFCHDQPARLENDLITLRARCEDEDVMRKAAIIPPRWRHLHLSMAVHSHRNCPLRDAGPGPCRRSI